MPENTSVASYDTYTSEHFLNQNYGAWTDMQLSAGTGSRRYAYLYFTGMPPHGATVFSATLSVYLRGASTWTGGPTTITAKRVNGAWSESKLTWAISGSGQLATGTHSATASVTSGTDGQRVDIDVTAMVQDVAAGAAWYGIRLEENTGNNVVRLLYASESTIPALRPTLTVSWSRPPDAPGDLAPGGGQSVSVAEPTLTWSFKDPDGDGQSAYQVQTCLDSTFGSVEFDTGWVTDSDTQVDLSATAYAGLSDGDVRFWRVRVKDTNGLASPWSAVATFRRDVKGTLALLNPPDGGFVEETTPPITTTLTGRAQTAVAYTLSQQNAKGVWLVVWNSGRFAAPSADGVPFTFNVPKGLIAENGHNYRLTAWSYDGIDRVATPGDPVSVSASAEFVFDRSSVPSPVTGLTVTPSGPGVELDFARATEPDYYALRVDDVVVFDRMNPALLRITPADPVNFLTGDSAEFEAGKADWSPMSNAAVTPSTTVAHSGTGSLKVTSSAAGNMVAAHCAIADVPTQGMPCAVGDTITVMAWLEAATAGRSVEVGAQFFDNTNTAIGSGIYGSGFTDVTGSFAEATATVTAPTGAFRCRVVVKVLATAAASEVHYIDSVWLSNGVFATTVNYGMVYYGAAPNESHTFEIEAVVEDAGVLKHSEGNVTVTLSPYLSGIWLVDDSASPYAVGSPVTMTRFDGQDSQDMTIGESSNVYYPIGRRGPVTVTDAIRGLEGTVTGTVTDDSNGYVASFRSMKQPEAIGNVYRLIYGVTNIPVGLGTAHLTPQPTDDGLGHPLYSVSIDVAQVGEFE